MRKSYFSLGNSFADHNEDDNFYRAMTLSWINDLKIWVVSTVSKDDCGKGLGYSANCSHKKYKQDKNKARSHPPFC